MSFHIRVFASSGLSLGRSLAMPLKTFDAWSHSSASDGGRLQDVGDIPLGLRDEKRITVRP